MWEDSPMTVLSDDQFHTQTLAKGGASRRLRDNTAPEKGYMVGGARTPDGEDFPEADPIPAGNFSPEHVKRHADEIREAFGKKADNIYQGSWIENGNVVLDASNRKAGRKHSLHKARKQNQRAIYDLRAQEDIMTGITENEKG